MVKLDLAEDKTETVLITNRRKNNTVKIRVGNHEVVSRYLGVMIDTKLTFKEYLDYNNNRWHNNPYWIRALKYVRALHLRP